MHAHRRVKGCTGHHYTIDESQTDLDTRWVRLVSLHAPAEAYLLVTKEKRSPDKVHPELHVVQGNTESESRAVGNWYVKHERIMSGYRLEDETDVSRAFTAR